MKMHKSFRLDIYEALDRISVQIDQLDRLYDHKGLTQKANKKIDEALESLAEAYQLQAKYFELCEEGDS